MGDKNDSFCEALLPMNTGIIIEEAYVPMLSEYRFPYSVITVPFIPEYRNHGVKLSRIFFNQQTIIIFEVQTIILYSAPLQ